MVSHFYVSSYLIYPRGENLRGKIIFQARETEDNCECVEARPGPGLRGETRGNEQTFAGDGGGRDRGRDTRNLRFNMITVLFPDGLNDSCAQENGFCTILEEIKFVQGKLKKRQRTLFIKR